MERTMKMVSSNCVVSKKCVARQSLHSSVCVSLVFFRSVILLFILRSLPVYLCVLGLWAAGQYAKKRRFFLGECSECTHTENCHIGKAAKRIKRCKNFMNSRCAIACKIGFFLGCLLARALPIWMVLPPLLSAMWCRRQLRQFKKGMCHELRGGHRVNVFERIRDFIQNLIRTCDNLDRALWNQLCAICRNPPKPATVGAAVAAAAAVLRDAEENRGMSGIQIPVAVPPNGLAFQQQTALLKEMGFQNTAALQQLLLKHSGNLQAVITEYMQLNKEKQA